jgi:hypothetical protein
LKKKWDKPRILETLTKLHKSGADLSYNRLASKAQALVSAASYHFGSYRRAVEKAGIDYAQIVRRPRWTKARITQILKRASRAREDLNWSSVTRRRDDLGNAAFASLQPRLFGNWGRALHAAGIDPQSVSRYRRWDRKSIVAALKRRLRNRRPLNSGAIQRQDPGAHAAAVRCFGSYDQAVKAAGIDPAKVRRRRRWNSDDVITELRSFKRHHGELSDALLRRLAPALYGAALRHFHTLAAARNAAAK